MLAGSKMTEDSKGRVMLNQFKNSVRSFHEEEDGIEAIQVVIILAIAAVALLVIKNKWETIKSFFSDNTDEATNWSP